MQTAYRKYFPFSLKQKAIGLLVSFLAMHSCKVAEAPKSEDLQKKAFTHFSLPSNWQSGYQKNGDTAALTSDWLAMFNDPDLDSLVSEALIFNLDLSVGETRIEQANGYVKMSQAALRPSLSLLGRGGTKLGGDFGSGLNGALFSASWELDIWGKLRNARNANMAQLSSVQSEYSYAQLSIAAAVARNWYLATENHLEIKLALQMTDRSQKLLDLAKKRFEIGVGTDLDVAIADANLQNLKDGLQKLQFAYNNQLRALEILVGRYPAAEVQVKKELQAISGPIPAGIPLQILERRPDLKAAEKRIAAAFYRIGEAKAARLPSLKLTASLGAITSEVLQLKPDFSNPFGGAGGTLIAPIYQGGSLRENIGIKTAEQKQAVAEYARAALNAIADVENALDAVQTVDDREIYLLERVKSNEKALTLEMQLFDVGKTDLRTVNAQQLELYAAEISLLRIRGEKITQRINLYLALGGDL